MEREKGFSSDSQSHEGPRGLLYILLFVFGFLALSLLSRRTPDQNSSESVHPQNTPKPEGESGQTQPGGPLIINAPTNPSKTEDSSKNNTPFWEKAAVLIALGLLVINIFLWCTTQGTLREIKKQTTFQRQQLVGSQAAILPPPGMAGFQTPEMTGSGPGSPEVGITLKNEGRVQASDIKLNFIIQRIHLPDEKQMGIGKPCDYTLTVLGIEKARTFECDFKDLSEADWESVKNFEETMSINGSLSYENGFGDRISENICLIYVPQVRTKYGLDGDGNFTLCDYFPATLARLKKRKAEK